MLSDNVLVKIPMVVTHMRSLEKQNSKSRRICSPVSLNLLYWEPCFLVSNSVCRFVFLAVTKVKLQIVLMFTWYNLILFPVDVNIPCVHRQCMIMESFPFT